MPARQAVPAAVSRRRGRRRVKLENELTFTRFEAACEKYPKNTAVVFLGEKYSYAKLKNLVDRFATGLSGLGLKKNDRMLLYLSNSVQLLVAFLAAQKIGVVVVLVSPIYTSHEIEYMANDAKAKAVICHDTNYGYVKEILPATGLEHVIVTNLLDLVCLPKRVVAFMFDKAPRGSVEKGAETVGFKTLLKSPPNPPRWNLTQSKTFPTSSTPAAPPVFPRACRETTGAMFPT